MSRSSKTAAPRGAFICGAGKAPHRQNGGLVAGPVDRLAGRAGIPGRNRAGVFGPPPDRCDGAARRRAGGLGNRGRRAHFAVRNRLLGLHRNARRRCRPWAWRWRWRWLRLLTANRPVRHCRRAAAPPPRKRHPAWPRRLAINFPERGTAPGHPAFILGRTVWGVNLPRSDGGYVVSVRTWKCGRHEGTGGQCRTRPQAARAGSTPPYRGMGGGAKDPLRDLMRRAVAARRALADVDEALARLAAGRFGRCEQCAAAIPAATLARTPEERYCHRCASGPPAGGGRPARLSW
jgi:hypothetical protein